MQVLGGSSDIFLWSLYKNAKCCHFALHSKTRIYIVSPCYVHVSVVHILHVFHSVSATKASTSNLLMQ